MSARVSSGRTSRQDYSTPIEFIIAVQNRWGRLEWDLAATQANAVAPLFISKEEDSLGPFVWPAAKRSWLNPPFKRITPWAAKCAATRERVWEFGGRLFFLVPAAIGSNWFAEHVHTKALVLGLRPRLSFDGVASFPKDLMLCIYGERPGFDLWRWK